MFHFFQYNRALKYKAGLKADNSPEKAKFPVSEYQREYEWKKFANVNSPLLNAEKIVFDSHTNIPRFVRDKVPRKTEYQSKYEDARRISQQKKKGKVKDGNKESEGVANISSMQLTKKHVVYCIIINFR